MATTDSRRSRTDELQELVAEADTGGRKPTGVTGRRRSSRSRVAWSLFQLWYASPLPFVLRLRHPQRHRGARDAPRASRCSSPSSPIRRSSARRATACRSIDWVLALAGAFAGAYLMLFYRELADAARASRRTMDIVVAATGMVLLLEATRRAVGWPMAVLAVAVHRLHHARAATCRTCCSTRARRSSRMLSHMWLTTEGVFGVALGVSTGTIFVYVLFGSLLDRAGGGNYMMQVSLRRARPPARRPGQGRGRVLGAERHDLRLVGVATSCRAASSPSR